MVSEVEPLTRTADRSTDRTQNRERRALPLEGDQRFENRRARPRRRECARTTLLKTGHNTPAGRVFAIRWCYEFPFSLVYTRLYRAQLS